MMRGKYTLKRCNPPKPCRLRGIFIREAMKLKGYLILSDGTLFPGRSFGAPGLTCGEVVFNTSMTGYQEILTDPSYCGQIVTMTYPLIGNYGINPHDFEAEKPFARGMIVREYCRHPNNWRATATLSDYFLEHNILGLAEIDTRALTRYLRYRGTMKGLIAAGDDLNTEELKGWARSLEEEAVPDFVAQVSTSQSYQLPGNGCPIVVMDLGTRKSIVQTLSRAGYRVTVVPATTPPEQILAINPSGVVFSGGPGDPKAAPYAVETARCLLGRFPLFGICLGHLILTLALKGDTYKLPFGHRGSNHPVKELATGRVIITSQNHGYAAKEEAFEAMDVLVTHRSLNDGTIEGMKHRRYPLICVQFHPEAYPGPNDSLHVFDEFKKLMN